MARLRFMVAAMLLLSAAQAGAQEGLFPFDNVRTLRSSYSLSARSFGEAFPFCEPVAPDLRSSSETYRTWCVGLCDGYYFPISQATGVMGLPADAERCAAACGGEARLFFHPNPGADVAGMLDFAGRSCASYPNAFKYRRALVTGCQCRPQPLDRSRACAPQGVWSCGGSDRASSSHRGFCRREGFRSRTHGSHRG